jgi:hypothetical protein
VTYRRVDHVAWRTVGRDTVVLDLKAKRVYAFNEPGGALWQGLVERGAVTAGSAAGAAAFLAELVRIGIVVPAEETVTGSGTPAEALLAAHAEPPRVTWNDDIRSFGISCLQTPIQGGCIARPTT